MNTDKSDGNSFAKQPLSLTKTLHKSVEAIRNDIGGLGGKIKGTFSNNKEEIDGHTKELEEGRKERA